MLALLGNSGGHGGAAETIGEWRHVQGKEKRTEQREGSSCFLWASVMRLVAGDKECRMVALGAVVCCRSDRKEWGRWAPSGDERGGKQRMGYACVCLRAFTGARK